MSELFPSHASLDAMVEAERAQRVDVGFLVCSVCGSEDAAPTKPAPLCEGCHDSQPTSQPTTTSEGVTMTSNQPTSPAEASERRVTPSNQLQTSQAEAAAAADEHSVCPRVAGLATVAPATARALDMIGTKAEQQHDDSKPLTAEHAAILLTLAGLEDADNLASGSLGASPHELAEWLGMNLGHVKFWLVDLLLWGCVVSSPKTHSGVAIYHMGPSSLMSSS